MSDWKSRYIAVGTARLLYTPPFAIGKCSSAFAASGAPPKADDSYGMVQCSNERSESFPFEPRPSSARSPSMADAQALSRRLGFGVIDPYYETPAPGTIFMARSIP
jgi:hypothetical protein